MASIRRANSRWRASSVVICMYIFVLQKYTSGKYSDRIAENPPEGQADPLAGGGGARDAVAKLLLEAAPHDHQAARLEHHHVAPGHALAARLDDEPARRAQRHRGDHRIRAELRLVVGVH